MRIIGLDIHRAFAEAVAWEDGRLRRLGRVDMRRAVVRARQENRADLSKRLLSITSVVHRCLALVVRCSMSFVAQAYSKACARIGCRCR
ncbi:hypothetical protein ABID25_006626 [Mesorhizobium abyssinicae]